MSVEILSEYFIERDKISDKDHVLKYFEHAKTNIGYVDIFQDDETAEYLKVYSDWPTYPQLYVDGELIGGSDIIREMHDSGELAELLKPVLK